MIKPIRLTFLQQSILLILALFATGVEACECSDDWTAECEDQFNASIKSECKFIKCGEIE